MDIMRVSTNFTYMMRTLPQKPREQWLDAAKAVIEHHFDNHEHCGQFCCRKRLSEEQRKESPKVYRNKNQDKQLYTYLQATMARFITKEALEEVGHGHDTQVNESLNNTISWYAPKNKTYSGSSSLRNRIGIALGVHSIGTKVYFERLFKKLGIKITEDIQHYLTKQELTRTRRIETFKKKVVKQERNKKLHDKLKQWTEELRKSKVSGDGAVYQPGVGMDGGYCLPATTAAASTKENRACSGCGQIGAGHLRPWSKKCPKYGDYIANKEKSTAKKQSEEPKTSTAVITMERGPVHPRCCGTESNE